MNKNIFRVIFSRALNSFVVVSELSSGILAARSSKRAKRETPPKFSKIALAIAGSMCCVMGNSYAVGIIADPSAPGNKQPTILSTANGTPQVNIQAPSAAGVSHNLYNQFNIESKGVILNNSRTDTTTQLGGYVSANPWLVNGSARVILNEVTSTNPSALNGFAEVAGQKAQVVIANPNGITCDGCGFINASRATLTTGIPVINNGDIQSYRVTNGSVTINGAGMDTSQQDFTDIIARSVQVNAGIWANQLRVTTGKNQVNADNTQATPLTADANKPAFALDVAALGGMYAGKIFLVGTEQGVGVRNAGNLYANAGDFTLTNDGNIENSGTIQSQNDAISIHSSATFSNTGNINAHTLVDIDTESLTNQNKIASDQNITIVATNQLINQSDINSIDQLTINTNTLDNQANASIQSNQLTINTTNELRNRGLINGSNNFLSADTLNNIGTGKLYGDHISISANTLNNTEETINAQTNAAVIAARQRLDIGVHILNNKEHALLYSNDALSIGGALDSNHMANGMADTVNNISANIEATGDAMLQTHMLNNINNHFSTQVNLVWSGNIIEYGGSGSGTRYLEGTPDLYIYNDESDHLHTPDGNNWEQWLRYSYARQTYETQIAHTDPAKITAGGNMQLLADTVNNDKSQIIAGNTLTANVGTLNNTIVSGTRTYHDTGTAESYWRNFQKGRDSTGYAASDYNPADTVLDISLTPTIYAQNTPSQPSGSINNISSLSFPTNSWYQMANNTAHYLVETDPRFTNYKTWLSSDYMLDQMKLDPATTQKRIGDGFYEQSLVRDQIAQLSGRRFLEGYATDEDEYRALMTSGASYAQTYNIRPGVALSATQMASLTNDIVLLVEKTVTLADGSTQQVLAPQVYLAANHLQLSPSGSLIAANDITINSDTVNNQGTLLASGTANISATNITNAIAGNIQAKDLSLTASNNITSQGSLVAKDSMSLVAGEDINLVSTTRSQQSNQGQQTNIASVSTVALTGDTAKLRIQAGKDINLTAANVSNAGTGDTTLVAGNNLTMNTLNESVSHHLVWDSRNHRDDSSNSDVGTSINTAGNLSLQAGKDINATASNVTSQGALAVTAGNDLNIQAGVSNQQVDESHYHTGSSDAWSSKSVYTHDTLNSTQAVASTFSGKTTQLSAAQDINLTGSNVVSDAGTSMNAGNDLTISAAQTNHQESHERQETQSGFMSGGSFGVSVGTRKQTNSQQSDGTQLTASTVGSVTGDVSLTATKNYTQTASDVLAPQGDINIKAQAINIASAAQTTNSQQEQKFEQSGLTLAIGGKAVEAMQSVQTMTQAASDTKNTRMKALAAANSVFSANQGINALSKQADGNSAGTQDDGVNLSLSLGSSSSSSEVRQQASNQQASHLTAGGNMTLNATGAGQDSNISVIGSDLTAGQNLSLSADNDIHLSASADTASQHSSNHSNSGSIGVSIGTSGFMVNAAVSTARGNSDGDDVTYNNSHLKAGQQASITSGHDTSLQGAVVKAEQVNVQVGNNLSIESLQDTSNFDSQQQSAGGGLSVGMGKWSANLALAQSKINSNYASVNEQSALLAGDGGFNVTVKGNTDLKGGVIASSDKAVQDNNNRFSTNTLSLSDIQNKADYNAQSVSVGMGTSPNA